MASDAWATRLTSASPTPSPPSSPIPFSTSAADPFLTLEENDNYEGVDISNRDDRAVYRESPFTLSKLRSAKAKKKKDGKPARRPIALAGEPSGAGPSSTTPAVENKAEDPRKKWNVPWRPTNGWQDAHGNAADSGATTKGSRRGAKTGGEAREIKRAPFKKEPKKKETKSAKAKTGKGRGKKKIDEDKEDKVSFGLLLSPIVQAFTRQSALPKKTPSKLPPIGSGTRYRQQSEPRAQETTLDIDELIGGPTKKGIWSKSGSKNATPNKSSEGTTPAEGTVDQTKTGKTSAASDVEAAKAASSTKRGNNGTSQLISNGKPRAAYIVEIDSDNEDVVES
ncbi:hypothetical protein Q5752_000323 [Cryptotrichosporon argae]